MSPRIAIRFLSDVRSDCRAKRGSTWADALFYRVESINRWFVLAVLLALWASGTSAASTPTLDVAQALDDPYLARAADMLEDASQALDLATVMALPDREWVPVRADVLPISYSRSAWWVRPQFTNSGDQME
jgi:7TMR-DISM extracellular 2